MKTLTCDVETTTHQNGNPFSRRNKLCYVGCLDNEGVYTNYPIEYNDEPYGEHLTKIQELIDGCDVLIGFNLKFDLHWLSRYKLSFLHKRVYDTQLGQFILGHQLMSYPSLDDCLLVHGLEPKLDEVKELWNKGIDTPDVPEQMLKDYLEQDVRQTYALYNKQLAITPKSKERLLSLANQDLYTLLCIEHNGMLFDEETAVSDGDKIQEQLNAIDNSLLELTRFPDFNSASGDHISVILYGGSISIPVREPYVFTYKDGRTATKERWIEQITSFPLLVKPLKGSALKKEGYYSTSADTLNSLKCTGKAKEIIGFLLKRASLEKLRGTYLHGLPKLIAEMDWEPGVVHGTMNQCTAITGRLSSSRPNAQNYDTDIGYLFKSRYI